MGIGFGSARIEPVGLRRRSYFRLEKEFVMACTFRPTWLVGSLRDSNQCGKRSAEIGKVSRPPLVRAWVQVAQAVLQHTR